MNKTRVAKLFKNGTGQAVRLPSEFRFDGDEVDTTRDAATGDVVLSSRPGAKTWGEFFELMRSIDVPMDFMAERPMNVLRQERVGARGGVFRQWSAALRVAVCFIRTAYRRNGGH
jgi:antitoxin VapB